MKKFSSIKWIIYTTSFYYIFLINNIVYPQIINEIIERISIEDDLSYSAISHIIQDKKGIMCLKTYNNLNKYNRYTFRVYRLIVNDSTRLYFNKITDLYNNNVDNIWIFKKVEGWLDSGIEKESKFYLFLQANTNEWSKKNDKF